MVIQITNFPKVLRTRHHLYQWYQLMVDWKNVPHFQPRKDKKSSPTSCLVWNDDHIDPSFNFIATFAMYRKLLHGNVHTGETCWTHHRRTKASFGRSGVRSRANWIHDSRSSPNSSNGRPSFVRNNQLLYFGQDKNITEITIAIDCKQLCIAKTFLAVVDRP